MGTGDDPPRRRNHRIRRSSSSGSVESMGTRHRSISPGPKKRQRHAVHSYWMGILMATVILGPLSTDLLKRSIPTVDKNMEQFIGDNGPENVEIEQDMYYKPDYSDEHFFDAFKNVRPIGLRWRDDWNFFSNRRPTTNRTVTPAVTVMPILTERRPMIEHHHRSVVSSPSPVATSSRTSVEPSLEEIELIDVLWRSDLAQEKGGPSEQYERDLQTLTEKSVRAPLTKEEASRYEDLSKTYFDDFYGASGPHSTSSAASASPCRKENFLCEPSVSHDNRIPSPIPQGKVTLPTPTDAELDALLEDVWKEGGPLDQLGGVVNHQGMVNEHNVLHNNVTLGVPYTAANLSEIDAMVDRVGVSSDVLNGSVDVSQMHPHNTFNSSTNFWYNHSSEEAISCYLRRDAVSNMTMAVEQMPPPPPVMHSSSLTEIGVLPTVYHSQVVAAPQQTLAPSSANLAGVYDPYYGRRSLSMSNESSVCSSTSSSSTSPRYGSETENHSPIQSRFYGKLLPVPGDSEMDRRVFYGGEDNKNIMRAMVPFVTGTQQPRRRGRQSKDEQLANAYRLPVSAADISEMTLPDLQKMLRSEELNDEQKTLIRKIRRRGKNKVAARTCRMRRGEVRTTQIMNGQMHWVESPCNVFRRQ